MAAKGARSERSAGIKLQWPQDKLGVPVDARIARARRHAVEGGTTEVTVDSLQILLEEYAQEIVAAVEGVSGETSSALLAQMRRLTEAVDTVSSDLTRVSKELVAVRRRIALQSRNAGVSE